MLAFCFKLNYKVCLGVEHRGTNANAKKARKYFIDCFKIRFIVKFHGRLLAYLSVVSKCVSFIKV